MPEQIAPRLLSWASLLEDQAREQAEATASLPWIGPHVALMPDAHWGMGSTVGSVVPTKDVVMPACVGVDIGCGMSATRTHLTKTDIEWGISNPLSNLRQLIEGCIPLGPGQYRDTLSSTARPRIDELSVIASDKDVNLGHSPKWATQLGTLGGGNHFIELCYDEEDRVWVFLHSGSRGVGNKIAQKHVKIARKLCERWYVDLPHPDLAFLPRGTDEYGAYLRELRWAQKFAYENRAEMVDRVIWCLEMWAGQPILREEIIQCHHNYTEVEEHFGGPLMITRKGAINAELGRRGLIPGSMGTCSYVVTGKGNPASFNSAPHGAGRNFSRNEARKRFTVDDLADAMKGIEWRSDIAEHLVDEIPGAYKPVDVVMADAADLVSIDHTLRQFLNVKGT